MADLLSQDTPPTYEEAVAPATLLDHSQWSVPRCSRTPTQVSIPVLFDFQSRTTTMPTLAPAAGNVILATSTTYEQYLGLLKFECADHTSHPPGSLRVTNSLLRDQWRDEGRSIDRSTWSTELRTMLSRGPLHRGYIRATFQVADDSPMPSAHTEGEGRLDREHRNSSQVAGHDDRIFTCKCGETHVLADIQAQAAGDMLTDAWDGRTSGTRTPMPGDPVGATWMGTPAISRQGAELLYSYRMASDATQGSQARTHDCETNCNSAEQHIKPRRLRRSLFLVREGKDKK